MNEEAGNLAVAAQFIAALEACDLDAVRNLYASDARLWHNFDQQLQPVEDNIRTLQWLHGKLDDVQYEIVRLEPIPGGFSSNTCYAARCRRASHLQCRPAQSSKSIGERLCRCMNISIGHIPRHSGNPPDPCAVSESNAGVGLAVDGL